MEKKEQILKEIHYRRDKQWNIFSWTSTIIVGAIGGVVTISSSDYFRLTFLHGLALSLSILLITIYSIIWLNHNWKREERATLIIKNIDIQTQLNGLYEEPKNSWGYPHTIFGLALVAILFFIGAPYFLQPDVSITFVQKSQKIIVTTPDNTLKYEPQKVDSAIKVFRNNVLPR